ncbi:MAG: HEAT repeat domain-containing protein [Promethearchaeota archaeon]
MVDEKEIKELIEALAIKGREGLKASKQLASIGPPALPLLLDALTDRKDDHFRQLVALTLGRLGTPAIPPLINLLDHEDPGVRKHAVDALGALQDDRRALQAILKARKDPEEEVRAAAWRALEHIPPHEPRFPRKALTGRRRDPLA